MAAIERVMKRLGFVQLSSYGLVLTPDGRILSLRPSVLDDGLGGRIVGWKDDDLVARRLAATSQRHSAPPATPLARPPAMPIASRVESPIASPVTPPVVAPVVAAAPVVEEDDWEWTIALARARAAAEEVELAAAMVSTRPVSPSRRMRAETVPPPVAPKTEPMRAIDFDDRTSPMNELVPVVRPTAVRAIPRPSTAPATVIPIPKLPSLRSTPNMTHVTPVVRSALPTPIMPPAPRRLAQGTGPVRPHPAGRMPLPSEDTVPNLMLPSIPTPRSISIATLPSVARAARS